MYATVGLNTPICVAECLKKVIIVKSTFPYKHKSEKQLKKSNNNRQKLNKLQIISCRGMFDFKGVYALVAKLFLWVNLDTI